VDNAAQEGGREERGRLWRKVQMIGQGGPSGYRVLELSESEFGSSCIDGFAFEEKIESVSRMNSGITTPLVVNGYYK
jgi:hypothetical protein